MLNYLHGELWRTFHKISSVIFFLLMLALPAAWNGGLALLNFSWQAYGVESRIQFSDSVNFFLVAAPTVGCFLVLTTSTLTFGDEVRLHTLKNSIASGMSRGLLYMGKFLTEFLYSLIGLFLALFSFLATGILFLPWEFAELLGLLQRVFWYLLTCIPLWVGVLGFLNFLLFSVQSDMAVLSFSALAVIGGFILVVMLPLPDPTLLYLPTWVIMLTGSEKLSLGLMGGCWAVGLAYAGIFSLVGYLSFFRREVK